MSIVLVKNHEVFNIWESSLKRVAGEFNVRHTCVTLAAEVDYACGYKRGVAGPNEIGGQFTWLHCSGL